MERVEGIRLAAKNLLATVRRSDEEWAAMVILKQRLERINLQTGDPNEAEHAMVALIHDPMPWKR